MKLEHRAHTEFAIVGAASGLETSRVLGSTAGVADNAPRPLVLMLGAIAAGAGTATVVFAPKVDRVTVEVVRVDEVRLAKAAGVDEERLSR